MTLLNRFIALVLLSYGMHAFAAKPLTITSVKGASHYSLAGTPMIYAGTAGPKCGGGNGLTCNSCAVAGLAGCMDSVGVNHAPLCMCNEQRISDAAVLRLMLKNSTKSSAQAVVTLLDGKLKGIATPIPTNTPSNGGQFVDFSWGNLCAMAGLGSCENVANDTTLSLNVFIDLNGDGVLTSGEPSTVVSVRFVKPTADYNVFGRPRMQGVGSFSLYPSDHSVYIQNLIGSPDFPALSYGTTVRSIRVFASEKGMLYADAAHADKILDMKVSPDHLSVSPNQMTGLKNGHLYYFHIALVDRAGNIVQYFPDDASLPASCTEFGKGSCPFSTVPQGGIVFPFPDQPAQISASH